MFHHYNRIKEKVEKEISVRKSLKEDLDELSSSKAKVEEELSSEQKNVELLKKEVDDLKAVAGEWERKYFEENVCRNKWEEAAKFLRNKYEDEEENINSRTFNFCRDAFLKSEQCRNMVDRINLVTIHDMFKQAAACVQAKHLEFAFPEEYQVYFDAEFEKAYAMPWEDGYDTKALLRTFPTPDNSNDEHMGVETVMEEGVNGENVVRSISEVNVGEALLVDDNNEVGGVNGQEIGVEGQETMEIDMSSK